MAESFIHSILASSQDISNFFLFLVIPSLIIFLMSRPLLCSVILSQRTQEPVAVQVDNLPINKFYSAALTRASPTSTAIAASALAISVDADARSLCALLNTSRAAAASRCSTGHASSAST